jgi:glycosyltransferase involved in cell wall biosynthesis
MPSFNKKILMINDQYNYLSSGGHWRTINLAEGLSYLKYDVWLATPHLKFHVKELKKIDVSNLIQKYNNNILIHLVNAVLPFRYALEKTKYKFVYLQLPMPITKGLCEFIFKLKSTPTILDFGDLWGYKSYESIFAALHEAIASIIVRNATIVTAASNGLANYLKRLSKRNVYVLNNSVDCINVFNPALYTFDREKFGIPKEKLVIIYSGTISKSKGVHNIVHVAENIPKDSLKELLFLIVGDGPYLNEMKINVKKLGLSNSFFFTGSVPIEEILKYLKLANLGIVPPSAERGGLLKLAYYMAMEIVPIVPPNSWPAEHIKHGINGFVARIEEYSDILNKLNKEQIYEMSKEARIYAINNFDIRNVAKRLINYLSENGY